MPLLEKQPGSKSFQKEKIARGSKPTINQKPRVLIVCEGKKTEPNYFKGFRSELSSQYRLTKKLIRVDGPGADPSKLLEIAKKEKEEGNEFNQIWIVFDRDEHKHFSKTINDAKDVKVDVSYSNPSFGLWYLLHFQDKTAPIERRDATKELKIHLPKYKKNDENRYSALKGLRKQAEKRAVYLRKMHKKNGNTKPEERNPCTTVDLMLKKIEAAYKKATP